MSSVAGLLAAAAWPSSELAEQFMFTASGDLAVAIVLGVVIGALSLLNGGRKKGK